MTRAAAACREKLISCATSFDGENYFGLSLQIGLLANSGNFDGRKKNSFKAFLDYGQTTHGDGEPELDADELREPMNVLP